MLSWLQIGLMIGLIGFLFSPAIDLPDFKLIYVLIIGSRTFWNFQKLVPIIASN